MDRRVPRRRVAILAFALVALPLFGQRIEIVSGDAKSVTYREIVPARVAVDPAQGIYHRKGCPAIRPNMQWLAPAAATLRGLKAHACQVAAGAENATHTAARQARDANAISVLFLGNSLTYYNEISRMTEEIGAREKRPLRVDAVTRSGATLEQLWNETDARKKLWLRQWDYVVLQGGAGMANPLQNVAEFDRYLALFAADVRKSGAVPLFYLVWRPGSPAHYERAALEAAGRAQLNVIPAGIAVRDLLRRGRFERLDIDGLHPDAFGAYLVACSVYSTIYGKPAHGAPRDFRHLAARNEVYDDALRTQTIDAEDARALQDAAWAAVQRMKAAP
ncbi:MAG: hypothetical protein ACJ74H_14390 [Thermoanaerobaculia bacterium]